MVLPFRSSNFFTSSWAISTCGSFWKKAATVTTRHAAFAHLHHLQVAEPMMQSAWPAAIICMMLTCGPPILMVTSSPYFL